MRILVVLTGGTISTIVQGNIMGISKDSPYFIIEEYQNMCKAQGDKWKEKFPDFDIIEPVRMLSECSRPKYLEQIYYGILAKLGIAESALDIREKGIGALGLTKKLTYDGIIVTHGSDTLSYSAAFFAVAFSWLPLPLVLTAANYPISDKNSNGLKNFSDSVDFIRQNLSGVFVVWENASLNSEYLEGNLYYAEELLEADNYNDNFSSYTGKAFGKIEKGECTFYQKKKERKRTKIVDIHMENDILFLRPYPGLRYDFISLEHSNIKAVVHYLYHSATACIEKMESVAMKKENLQNNQYNLLWFANHCNQLGIPLYLAGFKSKEQRLYETNDLLIKSGLGEPLYHVSQELAYMGILIAYNQTFMPVDEFLKIFMEQ